MIRISNASVNTISIELPPPPQGRLKVSARLSDGTKLDDIGVLAEVEGLEESYPIGSHVELTLVPNRIGETEDRYSMIAWYNGETSLTTTVDITEPEQEIYATFDAGPVTKEILQAWEGQTISGDYVQVEDIDLDGATWTGVTKFSGSFNGNGFTTSNFKLKMGEYQGLFLKLEDAIVQNLTVECNGFDESSAEPDFDGSFGGAVLVGKTVSSVGHPVRLLDITTKGLVCGDQGTYTNHNTGGMVARADYSGSRTMSDNPEEYIGENGLALIRCVNYAHVCDTRASGLKAGGVVGYTNSDIAMRDCANYGTVSTGTQLIAGENVGVGGLIGNTGSSIPYQHTVLHNCISTGTMEFPEGSTGVAQVCGWIRNGTINGIEVSGDIPALANLGSEIGWSGLGVRKNIEPWNLSHDSVSSVAEWQGLQSDGTYLWHYESGMSGGSWTVEYNQNWEQKWKFYSASSGPDSVRYSDETDLFANTITFAKEGETDVVLHRVDYTGEVIEGDDYDNYRLLNPTEEAYFNTGMPHRYLVTENAKQLRFGSSYPFGTFIDIDCSVTKPIVTFGGQEATETATSDPNVFRYTR